jgi:uncharacterized protein (UPF0261 family)
VSRLYTENRLDGLAGLGGTGGSLVVAGAAASLPVGVPKLLVSTVASGDTRPYVGGSDLTMTYSVVDIAGVNRVSARVFDNAAAAIADMALRWRAFRKDESRPVICASMFGVTTPCVMHARQVLEELGYGPGSSVPDRFRGRRLHEHTPAMSLMRTTPEECAELGHRIAGKLNAAQRPVAVFVPLRGISSIAVEGPFHDSDADTALADALRSHLDRSRAELHELDLDINDTRFAEAMAIRLHELCQV